MHRAAKWGGGLFTAIYPFLVYWMLTHVNSRGVGLLELAVTLPLLMPVVINLAFLTLFGLSLRSVPMIERFARLVDTDLNRAKVAHCRQVTVAWCVFFVLNATVALALALFADATAWAVYNGGLAYGLMGLLFAGEYVVRKYRFREYGSGPHDRFLARLFPRQETQS